MENFFVRAKTREAISENFIYDNSALVESSVLKFGNNPPLQLPFIPVVMKNMRFDYFLISEDKTLYRINKHQLEIESIGAVVDNILAVECGYDRVVILTDKELLLFNPYFDLEKSVCLKDLSVRNCNAPAKIRFGTDVISIIFETQMIMVDLSLKITGAVEEAISDAVFIKKYNKFACLVKSTQNTKFFEPNGLEHGTPLEASGDSIYFLNVESCEILLVSDQTHTVGYFMKNFFWYKKFVLPGNLHSTEENVIVILENGFLYKYSVFRELSEGLVINGNLLHYTNFQMALIPPPFYLRQISLDSQILCFSSLGNDMCLATSLGISVFSLDTESHFTDGPKCLFSELNMKQPLYVDLLMTLDAICLRTDSEIVFLDRNLKITELPMYLKQLKPANILKLYRVRDGMAAFCTDGTLHFRNTVLSLDYTFPACFDIQFNEDFTKFYLHSSRRLKEYNLSGNEDLTKMMSDVNINDKNSLRQLSDVSSFKIYSPYLLYISKNTFCMKNLKTDNSFNSYAEDKLEIITLRDTSVVFYTRFGTLESLVVRLLVVERIEKLISENKIAEAATKCDQNYIGYSLFFNNDEFPARNLCLLKDSQILSLFNCMEIPKMQFLLTNEHLKRLIYSFNPDVILKNIKSYIPASECIDVNLLMPFLENFHVNEELQPLKNCDFLFVQHNVSDVITLHPRISHINAFLKYLNPESNLTTIVNILMTLNRVDLCFYLPNQQRVIKILLAKISPGTICKASLLTFDVDKIISVHKQCQLDYATAVSYFTSNDNIKFAIYNYIEDHTCALFYLAKEIFQNTPNITTESEGFLKITNYATSHNLLDQLLMYTFFNVFNFNFYEYVATKKTPIEAFNLYKISNNIDAAIDIGKTHLFWRETLDLDSSIKTCRHFIAVLIQNNRPSEAAEIVKRLGDYSSAVGLYLKGRCLSEAIDLYQTASFEPGNTYDGIRDRLGREAVGEMIRSAAISYLRSDISELNSLRESLEKYKARLATVRARLGENMGGTHTTFSYSSMKSSKNALLKDRPGGIFENEYVLKKISDIVVRIDSLRCLGEDLLLVFDAFGETTAVETLHRHFEPFEKTLRSDIEGIWNYRRADVDIELPNVPMPTLSSYFD